MIRETPQFRGQRANLDSQWLCAGVEGSVTTAVAQDVMTHATLVATIVFAGAEDERAARRVLRQELREEQSSANNLRRSAAFATLGQTWLPNMRSRLNAALINAR
jgi:hypothetical protein